jgi:magnesium chelatase subunit H
MTNLIFSFHYPHPSTPHRAAVRLLVDGSTNSEGRVTEVAPFMKQLGGFMAGLTGGSPMKKALNAAGFSGVAEESLTPLSDYLEFCLKQIVANNEVSGMLSALEGRYITPGPGGDPIRNPDVLPTGKNMHGLDPQSIPTAVINSPSASVANARTLPFFSSSFFF